MERMGAHRASDYEGPTGIVGVLHSASADAGLPSMSLWASIPPYVAAAASPKAALALVRRVEGLLGVSLDTAELERATAAYERQVGLAVSSNPDVQAFVDRLEQDEDEDEDRDEDEAADGEIHLPLLLDDLPSGDLLASEFQRFLRQQGEEEPPRGSPS
jgi:PAC2 family